MSLLVFYPPPKCLLSKSYSVVCIAMNCAIAAPKRQTSSPEGKCRIQDIILV